MMNLKRMRKINSEEGAAVVEFSYTLFFLIAIVIICFQTIAIFGVKQQVNYAAFMAERSQAVGGNAVATANELINSGVQVETGSGIKLTKILNLPVNLRSPWSGSSLDFEVISEFDFPEEPDDEGDNR